MSFCTGCEKSGYTNSGWKVGAGPMPAKVGDAYPTPDGIGKITHIRAVNHGTCKVCGLPQRNYNIAYTLPGNIEHYTFYTEEQIRMGMPSTKALLKEQTKYGI